MLERVVLAEHRGSLMRWKYILICIAVFAAGVGIYLWLSTGGIPDDADELILFSVDGTKMTMEPEARGFTKDQELLYECAVLGRVEITDPALRREVIAAVKRDIRNPYSPQSKCFKPRHVLRIVKGGRTVDVVICFECHGYEVHRDNAPRVGPTPRIGESSNPLLNKILTDAGVPIAP
jgi:hypothetical protein